jgi:uncharacterized delta-60 repeat protein
MLFRMLRVFLGILVFSGLLFTDVPAVTPADSFNPNANGVVRAIAIQADGKVPAGGSFTTLGVATRNRISRLNADGSLDTFNPNANNLVHTLAIQPDGKVLIGGDFTTIGIQIRNRIARLNADGSLDTTFNPNANGLVNAIAVQADGKILVGGSFITMGGITRRYIARLNGNGSLDLSFNPNANNTVNSIALQADSRILMGGDFTAIGTTARNRIARLNADGSLDLSFNPNANNTVNSIALQADSRILAGGSFTVIGSTVRNRIARLNADGSLDLSFNPNAGNSVDSLTVQTDGRIFAGGSFASISGSARSFMARLNADGTPDLTIDAAANSEVNAITVQADGRILAGGAFTAIGGASRNRIARLINTATPSEDLTVTLDGQSVTWLRSGPGPEVWRTTFEGSSDGANWTMLGSGVRITGGWQLTEISIPFNQDFHVRARGYAAGGYFNGSSYFIETKKIFLIDVVPPNAPLVSGQTPTKDTTPTWSWISGGNGGNGMFRFKIDSDDLSSGATETTAMTFTPASALSSGTHTLYVQERDDAGNWSASGSKAIFIDTTVPIPGSIIPTPITTEAGRARTFKAIYRDADGFANLKTVLLLVKDTIGTADAVYARYDNSTDRLYLYNDSGSAVAGSCAPGSAGQSISNSQGTLNCGQTTVVKSGNSITVNWSITPAAGFASASAAKKLFMRASDNASNISAWINKGSWKIIPINTAPALGALTPPALSTPAGTAQIFTAVYRDADGWANLGTAELLVTATAGTAGAVYAKYNNALNKLYLFNDAGATVLPTNCSPGAVGVVISNSQGSLNCEGTTVARAGLNVTVNWSITPFETFAGAKKLKMRAIDNSNQTTGFIKKGDWTITAAAGSSVSVDNAKFAVFWYRQGDEPGSSMEEAVLTEETGEMDLTVSAQEIGIMVRKAESVLPEGGFEVVRHATDGIRAFRYEFDGSGFLKITDGADIYRTDYIVNSTGGLTIEGLRGQISPDGQAFILVDENSALKEEPVLLIGIRADTGSPGARGWYRYMEIRREAGQWVIDNGLVELMDGWKEYFLSTPDRGLAISVSDNGSRLRILVRQSQ